MDTIDYSPNPCAKDMTLHLTEEGLHDVGDHRMERFVRVWIKDRHLYAPNLKNLSLILEPDTKSVGITKFLQICFRYPTPGTRLFHRIQGCLQEIPFAT